MKIDVIHIGADITRAAETAVDAEQSGYDGYMIAEVGHDPFLPLVQAAARTSHIQLGTCIAGAFSRSPTNLAHIAWDLQAFSGGRFTLGLGPLVEAHVRHRFAMPWSSPAPRMRELVEAVRAVWDCWSTGGPLAFTGDHYQLSLMPPFFRPGPMDHPHPEIYMAAVGERMTEVAGEVGDGYVPHAFTTPEYLRERSLPALERGLARRGRERSDVTVTAPVFVVTGRTEDEMAAAAAATRQQVAFYASEATYRGVLAHHGWEQAQDELVALVQAGRMPEMAGVIDDTMLDAFAVVAEPDQVAERLAKRLGPLVDRISFYTPYPSHPSLWPPVAHALQAA